MPVLKNPRHEKFAQARFLGKSADDAYEHAGFKPNRGNAARLNANEGVRARVYELQSKTAKRAIVTVDSLTEELEEARSMAVTEKQSSAAVAAVMGKAKLHGLLIDKKRLEGPNGGPVQIDLNGYSLEQLQSFEELFAQLASAPRNNAEAGEGGDTE